MDDVKIELYELAKYLPYGLKLKGSDGSIATMTSGYGVSLGEYSIEWILRTGAANPFVRPLSDLIIPNKNGVTDMERLARMAYNLESGYKAKAVSDIDNGVYGMMFSYDGIIKHRFAYSKKEFCFCIIDFKDGFEPVPNQLPLFEFLFSRHYDVYGWIEKRLALSIHEL